MHGIAANKGLHPAAEWARETDFGPVQVDCTTAVVLKILDNKCKMLPGEKAAVLAIYDVVKAMPGEWFDARAHDTIARARTPTGASSDQPVLQTIHLLRVEAEARIPKPVMKAYKTLLREGLFG